MNSSLVVGKGESSTQKVHKILRFSTSFHLFREKWTDIARDLGIAEVDIGTIQGHLLLNKVTLNDALKQVLDLWVAEKGDTASLVTLADSLEQNGLTDCAQRLKKELQFYDAVKTYVCIPRTLKNVLDSKDFSSGLIILATLDTTITIEKIRENLSNCEIFSNYELLLNFVAAGNEWNILVVTDRDPNTLANLLENMSRNKPFDQEGKLVFVTDEEIEIIKGVLIKHRTPLDYAKIISDHMEWNDLNISRKHETRKRVEHHMGFQLKNELLETTLSGQTLVDLINNKDELKLIKSTLPEPCSYYVKRNLLTRNIFSEEAFKASSEDVFVFQGINRSELSLMIRGKLTANSSEQLQTVTSKFIVLDQQHHFTKICQISSDPVHLVRKQANNKWKWIKSKGDISNIQQHISRREVQKEIDEDALFTKMSGKTFEENIPVCISDSPGMGKSFLLAQIGRLLKRKFPDRIVAFVVLPELVRELNKMDIDNLETSIKLSLAKMVGENHLGEFYVESKLCTDDECISIELLLDGFDEIDYSSRSLSHEMLKTINSFKSVRMWVASRPHLLDELEQTLSVLGYNMQLFCEKNQIHFLTHFWSERLEMSEDKFDCFASTSLQLLKKNMNSSDEDIAGIPLQCLMIAEIFQDEAKSNAGLSIATTSTQLFTFIDLYDLLIKKKIELYYKKHDGSIKLTQEEILDTHKWLSLWLVFPKYAEKALPLSKKTSKYAEEILKIGLLEASSKLASPRFIHRTFAEYLTAIFVVEALGAQSSPTNDFLDLFYDQLLSNKLAKYRDFKGKLEGISSSQNEVPATGFHHPVICYFLNFLMPRENNVALPNSRHLSHFSTIQQIILASVTHSFTNILKLFSEDQTVKKFAKSIFNKKLILEAVQYANLDLIRVVFAHFEEHYELTEETQKWVFSDAVGRMEFSILEFLLKEKEYEELLKGDDYAEYIKSLLGACIAGTSDMDELLVERRMQIFRVLMNLNKNAIQLHTKTLLILQHKIHLKIIIELINLGADISERDSKGNTILINASRWLNEIEYEKLMQYIPFEKLGPPFLIRAHLSALLQYLVAWDANGFEPTFATLNILKDAGADFNNYGSSILSGATEYGRSSKTLKNLVWFGADVNWKGNDEESLLHLAAKHGNLEAARYYMDELKFDIDILDSNCMTPMDYSIMDFADKRNGKIEEMLSERGGLSNIAHLGLRSNLKMNYENMASITNQLLSHVKDDKVNYLRHTIINKTDLEVKKLLITTWFEVIGSNSLINLATEHNECCVANIDLIKHLVETGANVFETDECGRNFLHLLLNFTSFRISSSSFHEICEHLVEYNLTELLCMAETDNCGLTPLHLAVSEFGLEERTMQLLQNTNVSLNQLDKVGNSLLVYAVRNTDELITNLIKYGVNWKCPNLKGWNLLHFIAREANQVFINRYIIKLKYFLNLGLSPNDVNDKGASPLMIYLTNDRNSNSEFVKLLCDFGADINIKDNTGMTTLDYLNNGWGYGKIEILKYLIEKGTDIFAKDDQNRTFLHKFIRKRYMAPTEFHVLVKCLIQNKLFPVFEFEEIKNNSTPLHLVASKIEVMESTLALLQSAGINFISKDLDATLSLANAICGKQSLNSIDRLINYGADIFHLDNNGCNLLHLAAHSGTAESLSFLITKAKIITNEYPAGKFDTILFLIAKIANAFRKFEGLDVNRQDKNGNTPLHFAMLVKNVEELEEKVSLLLEAGVDASIKNKEGLSSLDILMKRGDIQEDVKTKLGNSLNCHIAKSEQKSGIAIAARITSSIGLLSVLIAIVVLICSLWLTTL